MSQSPNQTTQPTGPAVSSPKPWVTPAVQEMPRLTELTLQTSIPGGGGTGGGGSTVF